MKIDRKNDYAFKRIMGHEDTKDILARFLTVMLKTTIMPEEITLAHTELSPEYLADKAALLDIQVRRSATHEKMNIEMQVDEQGDFGRRMLYYWARGFAEELKEGEDYAELPRMISIVVTDFAAWQWRDKEKFHGVFQILERDERVLFDEALEIHILSLPQLRQRQLASELSEEECWGFYLDNAEGELMKTIMEREPLLARALMVEEVFAQNAEERRFYEMREKGRRDYASKMSHLRKEKIKAQQEALAQGRAQGIKEGEERGRLEEKRVLIKAMLAAGIAREQIAKVGQLSLAEIDKLSHQ
jgi:predicted transposase/invertase (TIGR01784 family)